MDGLHSPRILVARNLYAIRGHLRASPRTLGSGSPNFPSYQRSIGSRQNKRDPLPSFQRGWPSGSMYSLQTLQGIEQSKINSDSGALNMDEIYFDFELDNIISVKASRDTDPETLHLELRTKLQELLKNRSESFTFLGKYPSYKD